MGGPKLDIESASEIAKKQQKERDFSSLAQMSANAGIGNNLLRPPKPKKKKNRTNAR